MTRTCRHCQSAFEITPEDLAFYEKVSPVFNGKKELIPPPTLCPECREQRRLSFRNERNLYHRKCDKTDKQMISMYPEGRSFPVYEQSVWWSDVWDGLTYGRAVDVNRSFFEQFAELFSSVPRISLINSQHENSEYCNFCFGNKNSYLLFTSADCEDSYYCNRALGKSLCDCSSVEQCERCYEIIDAVQCYNCQYLQNCSNCSDCTFGYNLRGCRSCFGCAHLANAEYCIGNAKYSREEYEKIIRELLRDPAKTWRELLAHVGTLPRRDAESIGSEGCTGNNILHSKNAKHCFEVIKLEDCAYTANATHLKDCYDIDNDDHSELMIDIVGNEGGYGNRFCDICWFNKEILYCSLCFHSKNLFGCIGLRKNEYCILNQQYTKDEYERLVPQIIAKMKVDGEFGEFFPVRMSPFGYNESMAQGYFPRERNDVIAKGWNWYDEEEKKDQYMGPPYSIPENISDVPDDITKQILLCEVTKKPYKIIPQELKFYREMGIPIPRKCPDQRHRERMALRNPRKLWNRSCDNCQKPIATSYSPERPEKVLCEECYLKTVY